MRRFFGLIVLLAVVWWGLGQWRAFGDSRWVKVDSGLEMRTFNMTAGASRIPVYAFRTAADNCELLDGDVLTADKWQVKSHARVVVNGGYFDAGNYPLGLRVASGRKSSDLRQANWGVFYIREGRAYIAHTRDYKPSRKTWQAVQCGPRLVVNGRSTDVKPQWGRRTGIGIDRQGRVVLAIADGSVTLDAWAREWASAEGLDCLNALNLDGGGSTQLAVNAGRQKLSVPGLWPVPDALAFK